MYNSLAYINPSGVPYTIAPVYINQSGVLCTIAPVYINPLGPCYRKLMGCYQKFTEFSHVTANLQKTILQISRNMVITYVTIPYMLREGLIHMGPNAHRTLAALIYMGLMYMVHGGA